MPVINAGISTTTHYTQKQIYSQEIMYETFIFFAKRNKLLRKNTHYTAVQWLVQDDCAVITAAMLAAFFV